EWPPLVEPRGPEPGQILPSSRSGHRIEKIIWLRMPADPAASVRDERTVESLRPQQAAERCQNLRRLVVVHRDVPGLRVVVAPSREHQRGVLTGARGAQI